MTAAQRELGRCIKRQAAEVARLRQLHSDARFMLRLARAEAKRLQKTSGSRVIDGMDVILGATATGSK